MIVNFLKFLSNLPRRTKAIFLLFTDLIFLGISLLMAFAFRFDPVSLLQQLHNFYTGIWLMIAVQFMTLTISRLYRSVLRHAGAELFFILLRSVLIGAAFFTILVLIFEEIRMPRTIIVMSTSFSFFQISNNNVWLYH